MDLAHDFYGHCNRVEGVLSGEGGGCHEMDDAVAAVSGIFGKGDVAFVTWPLR